MTESSNQYWTQARRWATLLTGATKERSHHRYPKRVDRYFS